MAAHNSSPMPGVHPNPDPALDIAREHEHQHLHHSAHAAHVDNSTPVYTTGTTDEKVSKLFQPSAQDSSHLQHRHVAGDDIEKNGTFANYDEKATRSSSDPENVLAICSVQEVQTANSHLAGMFLHRVGPSNAVGGVTED
jgi:CNT family concentrative nucleoside transporter